MTVRVNLKLYDWIVINTSAGKDSQAMMDWVVRLAEAAGVKDRVVAVHAEIEEEWPGCRDLAAEHAAHYGVRFEVVKRPQGGILQHVLDRHDSLKARGKDDVAPWPSSTARHCTAEHKRSQVAKLFTQLVEETRRCSTPPWPSSTARFCTSHLKANQVSKLLTQLAREKRAVRPVRILNCLGMRAAESCARSKLKPFRLDRMNTNGRRTVHIWLPLFYWTVDMVWSRIRLAGTRSHFAYDLGMGRLSCPFCFFAPRNALLLAGKHNRELLDRYCEVEEKTGFSFRVGLPLVEVRAALEQGEEPGEIRAWEMP